MLVVASSFYLSTFDQHAINSCHDTHTHTHNRRIEHGIRSVHRLVLLVAFLLSAAASHALTYTVVNQTSESLYKLFVYYFTTGNQYSSYVVTNIPPGVTTVTLPPNADRIDGVRIRCAAPGWPVMCYYSPTLGHCQTNDPNPTCTFAPDSWQNPGGHTFCFVYNHYGNPQAECMDDQALRIFD